MVCPHHGTAVLTELMCIDAPVYRYSSATKVVVYRRYRLGAVVLLLEITRCLVFLQSSHQRAGRGNVSRKETTTCVIGLSVTTTSKACVGCWGRGYVCPNCNARICTTRTKRAASKRSVYIPVVLLLLLLHAGHFAHYLRHCCTRYTGTSDVPVYN